MTETTNYKLKKPGDSDNVRVDVLNGNMDVIDRELKQRAVLGPDGKVPDEQLPKMDYDSAGAAAAVQESLNTHTQDKQNPHDVTARQIGAISSAEKGQANGVAALDETGKVPPGQLPEMAGKPKRSRITLSAAGWKSEPTALGGYKQSVMVPGILVDETQQLIMPMPEIASQAAYAEAGIACVGQGANTLTFSAQTAPAGSIAVYVAVQEVTA